MENELELKVRIACELADLLPSNAAKELLEVITDRVVDDAKEKVDELKDQENYLLGMITNAATALGINM